MTGPVSGGRGRRWEKGGLGADLVGGLVHFGLDLGLSYRICELNHQVVVQVVLVWALRLFSNARADNLTLDTVGSSRGRRGRHRRRGRVCGTSCANTAVIRLEV
jgi:hypothetical protein